MEDIELPDLPPLKTEHWRAVLAEDQRPHQLHTRLHVVGFRSYEACEGFVASELDMKGWRYAIEELVLRSDAEAAILADREKRAQAAQGGCKGGRLSTHNPADLQREFAALLEGTDADLSLDRFGFFADPIVRAMCDGWRMREGQLPYAPTEASKPVQAEAPTRNPYRIDYDNDTGKLDDWFEEWWSIVDERTGAEVCQCTSEADAKMIRAALSTQPTASNAGEQMAVGSGLNPHYAGNFDEETAELADLRRSLAKEIDRLRAALAQVPEQVAGDSITLKQRMDELIEQHGSLRAVGRVLEFDPGYLSRLASGEKSDPGAALLRRMGLREVTGYVRAASKGEAK